MTETDFQVPGDPGTEVIIPRSTRYRLSNAEVGAALHRLALTADGSLIRPQGDAADPLAILRAGGLVDPADRVHPFLADAIAVAACPARLFHVVMSVPGSSDWLDMGIGGPVEGGPYVTVRADGDGVDLQAVDTAMEVAAVLDDLFRLTSYAARPVDPDLALTLPAWVGLLAVADVRRLRRLRNEIRRQPAGDEPITLTDVEGAITVGLASADSRWAVTAAIPIVPVALRERTPSADRALDEMGVLGLVTATDGAYSLTELGRGLVDVIEQTILFGSLTLTYRRPGRHVRGGELLVYRAPTRLVVGVWSGTAESPLLTLMEPMPEAAVEMMHRFVELPDRQRTAQAPPPPPFEPSHRVPAGGLDRRESPDDALAPIGRLAESTAVRVLARTGDWAEVVTESGARSWVDGRRLVTASAGARWSPTHRVGEGGSPAWARPDATEPAVTTLPEGARLEVVQTSGVWTLVRAEDGWEGWVDGRRLLPS